MSFCLLAQMKLTAFASPSDALNQKLFYPSARREQLFEDYGGTRVQDPYGWLENLDAPETRSWVRSEAHLTQGYLDGIPVRLALKDSLTQLLNFEKYGLPFRRGRRLFYTHNSGLQQQSLLYVVEDPETNPAVVLDPNRLSTNGVLAVVGYVASPDGALVAYGVSEGGSDWTDWRVRDVRAARDLSDVLRWTKYYRPVFSPDGRGLFYSAFPAPPPGQELGARDLGNAVYYHALGTASTADRKILEQPEHPDWQFEPHLGSDGRWLVVCVGEGEVGDKGLENVYAVDLANPDRKPLILCEGFKASYEYVGADAGLLFFQTSLEAPRGRILGISPESPSRTDWKTIIPEGKDAMESTGRSVSLVDHQFIVRTLHDAHSEVSVYGLDGRFRYSVSLPGKGTVAGFSGEAGEPETFYSYTDFVHPPSVYRLEVSNGHSTLYRAPKVAFALQKLETRQVFYPSKDGTRIPMYLVYKRGLKLNGSNPTLLYGYGGFGISVLPHFDATRLAWLERGGIFAVANLRGGGEYGEDWHRQAIRTHKQLVFDDFITAAEWLISHHYTSTAKLAIEGGSNGGLLVGACLTQRPDLYGAALAYVGVMDMLRFNKFGQGAGWIGDYGSPQNPEDFKALLAYSPYHNVHAGVHYPATLIITGDHDARVMPAHSFKFAAALQAAQAGHAPILLRVRLSTGHGSGPTTSQLIDEKSDAYAFLIKNLGMPEE